MQLAMYARCLAWLSNLRLDLLVRQIESILEDANQAVAVLATQPAPLLLSLGMVYPTDRNGFGSRTRKPVA